jgi:cystathionine beta-lyase/cystathionine gamma-synthase
MEALQNHPKVEKIHHPFIDEQQALAVRQMKGGGLFTLALKATRKDQVIQFCDSLENFLIAVSWGGHESLIMPVVTFYDIPGQPDPELPWNLVRFYIGLEDPHYLLGDILQALDRIS